MTLIVLVLSRCKRLKYLVVLACVVVMLSRYVLLKSVTVKVISPRFLKVGSELSKVPRDREVPKAPKVPKGLEVWGLN